MTSSASDLSAESQRLRDRLQAVTDPAARAELSLLVEELERRARATGNGDASRYARPDDSHVTLARQRGWLQGQAPGGVTLL